MQMRGLIITCLLIGAAGAGTPAAQAQSSSFSTKGFTFTIQPIASYQLLRTDLPNPHQKFMFMYGARVTIGHPKISGEAEYQMGSSTEIFPAEPLTLKEDREQAKLGLSSRYQFGSFFDGTLRGGGQASRAKREEIRLSGVTKTTTPIKIAPYIGVGLGAQYNKLIGISLEATVVLPDFDKPTELEVQSSVALRFQLGG